MTRGGGDGIHPPMVICLLLKKSLDDPYLKFLDFFQQLVANTHMIFFSVSMDHFVRQSFWLLNLEIHIRLEK